MQDQEISPALRARMEDAARRTAEELVARGIASEAWAEGTTVHARIGRYHWTMINRVTPGPPGLTERVRQRFAAMVIDALNERLRSGNKVLATHEDERGSGK